MKLEEIQSLWEKDSVIDRSELGEESLKIPQLHSKYYKIYSDERMSLRKLDYQYINLKIQKYSYYYGSMSEEELKERGWEPNPLKILKSDIPMYIESDSDIIAIQAKIDMQKEKVEFVESVIKTFSTRGYQIKSAIDWAKFQVGL
jgi:hypothetical protein